MSHSFTWTMTSASRGQSDLLRKLESEDLAEELREAAMPPAAQVLRHPETRSSMPEDLELLKKDVMDALMVS